jgi:hypothetical protein
MTLHICERKLHFAHCTARLRIYTGLSVLRTFQVLKYRLCFEILVLSAVIVKSIFFWDVMQCISVNFTASRNKRL